MCLFIPRVLTVSDSQIVMNILKHESNVKCLLDIFQHVRTRFESQDVEAMDSRIAVQVNFIILFLPFMIQTLTILNVFHIFGLFLVYFYGMPEFQITGVRKVVVCVILPV